MLDIIAFIAVAQELTNVDLSKVKRDDMQCLSTVVYHEARGEDVIGQMAVAHVVLNRVNSKRYPDSVCGVVYQSHQFTNVQHAKPNRGSAAWGEAMEVAMLSVTGMVESPIGNAKHYYNPHKVSVNWDNGEPFKMVGNHKFLEGVR